LPHVTAALPLSGLEQASCSSPKEITNIIFQFAGLLTKTYNLKSNSTHAHNKSTHIQSIVNKIHYTSYMADVKKSNSKQYTANTRYSLTPHPCDLQLSLNHMALHVACSGVFNLLCCTLSEFTSQSAGSLKQVFSCMSN